MEYDGSWTLTLPQEYIDKAKDWPRPFLSNGKITVRPALDGFIDMPRTRIVVDDNTPEVMTSEDIRAPAPNSLETFNFGRVHFFGQDLRIPQRQPPLGLSPIEKTETKQWTAPSYKLKSAKLRMDVGTFESTHEVWKKKKKNNQDPSQNGGEDEEDKEDEELAATVTRTVYPCRAHQYLVVQSFSVHVEPGYLEDACFIHDLTSPPDSGAQVDYSSPIIFSEGTSAVMFCGDAPTALGGKGVSVACSYTWTNACTNFSSEFEIQGFNVVSSDVRVGEKTGMEKGNGEGLRPARVAFNRVKMIAPEEAFQEGSTGHEFRFHILTCMIGGGDMTSPSDEAKRMLLQVLSPPFASTCSPVSSIRSNHVAAWDRLWKLECKVVPKVGLDPSEIARINRLQRHLRYAYYLLHSCARTQEEGKGPWSLTQLRRRSSGLVDPVGDLLSMSDLWLVPAFILFRPEAARSILNYRIATVDAARLHASIVGRPGAFYPLIEPSVPVLALTFYQFPSPTPLHVFNSALLAANLWDYFRSTKDREWLREEGYPVIQHLADFLRSCFVKAQQDGRYLLIEAVPMDGVPVGHDTFSVNSCMLAFRAAIEASYVLRRPAKNSWREVVEGVKTIYLDTEGAIEPELKWVYRKNIDDVWTPTFDPKAVHVLQTDDKGRVPWRTLADPLFVTTPAHAQVAHPYGKNLKDATRNNLAYYEPRLGLNLDIDPPPPSPFLSPPPSSQ